MLREPAKGEDPKEDPFDTLNLKERGAYYAAMVDKYSRLHRLEEQRLNARTEAEREEIQKEIKAAHKVTIQAATFKRSEVLETVGLPDDVPTATVVEEVAEEAESK